MGWRILRNPENLCMVASYQINFIKFIQMSVLIMDCHRIDFNAESGGWLGFYWNLCIDGPSAYLYTGGVNPCMLFIHIYYIWIKQEIQ